MMLDMGLHYIFLKSLHSFKEIGVVNVERPTSFVWLLSLPDDVGGK